MGGKTTIEWTEATWNPTRGCSLVSAGCTNCYAMRLAHRFSGNHYGAYAGLTRMTTNGPVWTGEVRLEEDMLDVPLKWKSPRRVFVNSMSDLFHESLPDEAIDKVFAVMALCPQHTFQVLTKRAERMQKYLLTGRTVRVAPIGRATLEERALTRRETVAMVARGMGAEHSAIAARVELEPGNWPLPNVWLGVSVEDQKTADERIPWLLKTPAAVRWVSYEPALEGVNFDWPLDHPQRTALSHLDWIIVGGESGPGARPFDIQWARNVIAAADDTAVFIKQLGAKPYEVDFDRPNPNREDRRVDIKLKNKKGGDISEWPADLRIREFPNTAGTQEV